MTPEQIRKMTDKQLNDVICNYRDGLDDYVSDLNAAMLLVPQVIGVESVTEFTECLGKVIDADNHQWWHWAMNQDNKPRALCEAYLLWKDGAK